MKKITEILLDDLEDENVDKPNVRAKAELVSFSSTPEVTTAIKNLCEQLREALAISPADWPKGRVFEVNVVFAIVPLSIKSKVY